MELRRSLETSPLLGLVTLAGRVVGQRWDEVTTRQHGMSAAGVSTLLMIAWGTGRSGVAEGTPGRARVAELANRLWVRPATVTGIIVTPITAVAPTEIAEPDHVEHFGRTVELRDCVLPFTTPQDVFGLPACAVPVGGAPW